MAETRTLPSQMTAIAIRAPGGPEALVPESRPLPKPGEREVLVKVAAAGVNRPDILQRMGLYPPPKGASDVPGLEISGQIVALGPHEQRPTRFKVGDAITALLPGGGYAEYSIAHEDCCLPIPSPLSMIEAASLPETFFTVWHNVFERGALKNGETLLVHGGSSGIGTTAIQLAKAFGAKVIVTAGSAEKCEACLTFGADHAVNYKERDFVAETKSFTAGHGADVILDMVGGDYIARNYQAAAVEGRIVNIAFQRSSRVEIDFLPLMLKRLTHTGSTLRSRPVSDKSAIARALEREVWPLISSGRVKPIIDRTFPLSEASKAHALMETGMHIGKIVLVTNR